MSADAASQAVETATPVSFDDVVPETPQPVELAPDMEENEVVEDEQTEEPAEGDSGGDEDASEGEGDKKDVLSIPKGPEPLPGKELSGKGLDGKAVSGIFQLDTLL